MTLVQTLDRAINGFWDGGSKSVFEWDINAAHSNAAYSQVGSWEANYFFTVATGKTDKATLGNARRSLAARAKRAFQGCKFEYKGE